MVRKFFPLDKNYLLEAAQLRLRDLLLTKLVQQAGGVYQQMNNPLGLNDSFSETIRLYHLQDVKPLSDFYLNLSGIYRYKHGETQLNFLWDGKDHLEKYEEDWSAVFQEWTSMLCRKPQFVQAVLDLTVFLPLNHHAHLVENRMNGVMLDLFEMKIHKQKGLVKMKVA